MPTKDKKLPNDPGDNRDAVEAYLQDEYKVPYDESKAYAKKLRGQKQDENGITGAALSRVADQEKERLARINHYTDIAKRFYAGEKLDKEDQDYFDAVHERTAETVRNRAKDAAAEPKHYIVMPKDAYTEYKAYRDAPATPPGTPTWQQRMATIQAWRPGMVILPNQAGLEMPPPEPQMPPYYQRLAGMKPR